MTQNKNYDSAFCGSLPIHHINLVQPYGILLVLDKNTLEIVQASENAAEVFQLPVNELVNNPLSAYVDSAAMEIVGRRPDVKNKIPLTLQIQHKKYLGLVHAKADYLLLELELESFEATAQNSFAAIYQEIKYAMVGIDEADSTRAVCSIAAKELKRLSGFDKVMIYHFDDHWNGTVIAEEMEPGMESYYGFTFPASDIPKQARDLYQRNPYRFIPDREYAPVKLYPVINPVTHSFVDLSDCNIRGVAAVHLEYLKNMEVVASMSTRIMHGDKLWGLIACHHRTAKHMSYEMCSVFELLSNVLSGKVTSLISKEHALLNNRLNDKHARFIEQVYSHNNLGEGFTAGAVHLLALFNATGAALVQKGKTATTGQVPSADELQELVFWLNSKNLRQVWNETHLSGVYDHAERYQETASGLLVIPLNSAGEDYLMVFRPEVVRTVNWGGNPDEAIRFEADGKQYHPRYSFKLWQQTVKSTSLPWLDEEIRMAESLRSFIYEFNTRQILS